MQSEAKINIVPEVLSIHSMTSATPTQEKKTTIKVFRATRSRVKVLAASLELDMDEVIVKAVDCLEKSLAGEEVKENAEE